MIGGHQLNRADALHRLADVTSVLVEESDLAGTLARVVAEAAAEASAGGLFVLNGATAAHVVERAQNGGRSSP